MALVGKIYNTLNLEAAKTVSRTDYSADSGEPFRWSDYPQTRKQIDDIQAQFVNDIGTVIYRGTSEEWKNSNEVQDLMANKVLKAYDAQVDREKYKVLYQTNPDALKAFQNRKDRGMNLSAKLWNQSEDYRKGLESAISCAIRKGTSAITLSKQISKYLNDFPSLQKDYKELYGRAANIKDCEYRSIRLARSEINMAYRSAENERWRQMDFVVGYEIKTTQNGKHVSDVCDDLAGKYPKDFVWTGWHPNCRCYKIPLLKTEEEFWEWDGRSEASTDSVNAVKDVPDNFKAWVKDNAGRIENATRRGTLPYFIKDNKTVVDGIIRIENNRKEYESYDDNWKRVCFYEKTGGYVVAHVSRVAKAGLNKQEAAKYNKELGMSRVFASAGNKIEMLEEIPRISSPDVHINGLLADLKRTKSHNNLVHYAKKAIYKQGANIVLFQFDVMTPGIRDELNKLKSFGIKCKYFITGENKVYDL